MEKIIITTPDELTALVKEAVHGLLCIMCLFFILTAFYQQKEIITYKDNDLKYRYVQMQGETTPAGVNDLDSIFENRRDVRMIRKLVKQQEKAVIEKARRLERARLKEQEVEQLRQDVENFKHKNKFHSD